MAIEIHGMDELIDSVNTLIRKYPDRSGDFLRKQAMETRKGIAAEARSAVNVNTSNKASLGKATNYKVSQVKGIGADQYVELTAKSPHFHLIEHGHEQVTPGGRHVGYVQGYKILDAEAKRQEIKLPRAFEEMAEKVLSEEGFL